jgi:hypothetical protein
MPGEQVDAMIENRTHPHRPAPAPAARPGRSPVVTLLQELARRPAVSEFSLTQADGDTVVWRRA